MKRGNYYKPRYRAILTLHISLNTDCNLRITQNRFQLFFMAVSVVSKLIFREIPDFLCTLKLFITYRKFHGLLMSTLWFTLKTVTFYFLRPPGVPVSNILRLYYAFNLRLLYANVFKHFFFRKSKYYIGQKISKNH